VAFLGKTIKTGLREVTKHRVPIVPYPKPPHLPALLHEMICLLQPLTFQKFKENR
jgi:hypothetical protein